ncbi:MAG: SurA N-terminal domain-containing protein [Enterobacterales bacterium]|nr:SurA N-terminal domain-containing protein [Enterobacterales bacterium]
MMDSIREGVKKPWAKGLIFVIVISFVGAGYFTSALFLGDRFAAAVVNDESISTQEFERAYSRARQQYGEAYKQIIKTDEQERNFRENVLQSQITRVIALQAAKAMGMRISVAELRQTIQSMEALQKDGVYSAEMLDLALTRIGMSRSEFKRSMQSDLLLGQLSRGITSTEFLLASESENEYRILGQQRSGRALTIPYALFKQTAVITDQEIEDFYQKNLMQFKVEEKLAVDYIELNTEEMKKNVKVSEEAIEEYYNDNITRFKTDDKRRVSHILIALGDDEGAALTKATEIKKKLDAGADFIALVKSESDDEFSAESDGDLGVIEAGAMEEPFEQAVSLLSNVGQLSEPVKSSFGYHIIKLTELQSGTTKKLADVKDKISSILQGQLAEEAFFAKSKLLEEKSYEVSDSLTEVATLVETPIKTSPLFSRKQATGIFANNEVLNAAFSDTVLLDQMNSKMISIDDSHVVVMRINKHQPSHVLELSVVKDKVVAQLQIEKAKTKALEFANKLQQMISNKENTEKLLAGQGLKWKDLDNIGRTGNDLPYMQLQQFFKMRHPDASGIRIDKVESFSDVSILVLNKVLAGDITKAEASMVEQNRKRLEQFFSEAVYRSLVENERSKADISLNLENINR